MYQAIGQQTIKRYMTGKRKRDVMRELQKKYPSNTKNEHRFSKTKVYPEPLRIVEVVE